MAAMFATIRQTTELLSSFKVQSLVSVRENTRLAAGTLSFDLRIFVLLDASSVADVWLP